MAGTKPRPGYVLKVLILKPSSLGDVIHALPVARLLRRQYPHCEIHWWLSKDLLPLLEGDPDITRLIPFNRRRWWAPNCPTGLWQTVRAARHERYDLVIDLQGLLRSALFGWLANGAFTVGVLDKREGGSAFYDLAIDRPGYHSHAVEWYLSIAKALGLKVDMGFEWLPERPLVKAEIHRKWPLDDVSWIVFCPGARWENKQWPLKNFAELADDILHQHASAKIVILGGREDAPKGQILHQRHPERILDLTGCTSLAEMVEWIRISRVVVTNDTGPMHVAAAMSKPVVAFFGPTAPERTGPYGQIDKVLRANLACMPCLQRRCRNEENIACLHAIRVGEAAAQTSALLI